MDNPENNTTVSQSPGEPKMTAETGIKRDWVAMPKTPDPSVRFCRIEEQLELSAGIQESNVEQIFTAFEGLDRLSEAVKENTDMFTQLIGQMEKDRQENARRFDRLCSLVESKLNKD